MKRALDTGFESPSVRANLPASAVNENGTTTHTIFVPPFSAHERWVIGVPIFVCISGTGYSSPRPERMVDLATLNVALLERYRNPRFTDKDWFWSYFDRKRSKPENIWEQWAFHGTLLSTNEVDGSSRMVITTDVLGKSHFPSTVDVKDGGTLFLCVVEMDPDAVSKDKVPGAPSPAPARVLIDEDDDGEESSSAMETDDGDGDDDVYFSRNPEKEEKVYQIHPFSYDAVTFGFTKGGYTGVYKGDRALFAWRVGVVAGFSAGSETPTPVSGTKLVSTVTSSERLKRRRTHFVHLDIGRRRFMQHNRRMPGDLGGIGTAGPQGSFAQQAIEAAKVHTGILRMLDNVGSDLASMANKDNAQAAAKAGKVGDLIRKIVAEFQKINPVISSAHALLPNLDSVKVAVGELYLLVQELNGTEKDRESDRFLPEAAIDAINKAKVVIRVIWELGLADDAGALDRILRRLGRGPAEAAPAAAPAGRASAAAQVVVL